MDKRKLLVVLAVVIALAISVWLLFFYEKPLSQEEIIQKQLEELNTLRNPDELNPTEEELSQQAQELDKLRSSPNHQNQEQEEANKQLEELDKLKGQ